MKKIVFVMLVVFAAVTMIVTPVMARSENSNGSVKVNLIQYIPPPGPPPPPPGPQPPVNVVGSTILNTTASGKLIVNVNMDTVPNLRDYDVLVFVRYYPPPWPTVNPPAPPPGPVGIFPDVLDTNAQGQGNATVMVDIDPHQANESIWVLVNIREGPTDPATPPAYTIMGPPVEVPLK